MEPRPHSGGAKRVDSKADGPVFHPGRGAYTTLIKPAAKKPPRMKERVNTRLCVVPWPSVGGAPQPHILRSDHTVKANGLMVTSAYPGNRINLGLNLSPVVHS